MLPERHEHEHQRADAELRAAASRRSRSCARCARSFRDRRAACTAMHANAERHVDPEDRRASRYAATRNAPRSGPATAANAHERRQDALARARVRARNTCRRRWWSQPAARRRRRCPAVHAKTESTCSMSNARSRSSVEPIEKHHDRGSINSFLRPIEVGEPAVDRNRDGLREQVRAEHPAEIPQVRRDLPTIVGIAVATIVASIDTMKIAQHDRDEDDLARCEASRRRSGYVRGQPTGRWCRSAVRTTRSKRDLARAVRIATLRRLA